MGHAARGPARRKRGRAVPWLIVVGVAAGCAGGPVDEPAPTGAPTSTATTRGTEADVTTSGTDGDDGVGADLFHPAGVVLQVPTGWEQRHGPVVATEFATAAACRTAVVVDDEPPPHPSDQSGDGGEGTAQQLQTLVQVCATPTGGQQLEDHLRATYGDIDDLDRTEVGGRAAYRADAGSHTVVFTQTDACRFQIATAVDAEPALAARRQGELRAALASIRFEDPPEGCG